MATPNAQQTAPEGKVAPKATPVSRQYISVPYLDPSRPAGSQWVVSVLTYDGRAVREEVLATAHVSAIAKAKGMDETLARYKKVK